MSAYASILMGVSLQTLEDIKMSLCIISYNCFSIRKRVDTIKQMLQIADILVCQEIILLDENCDILSNFNADFNVLYVPSTHPASQHGDGRPVGGLAVFYRKELQVTQTLSSTNYQALKVGSDRDFFYLLNVYMPTDNRDCESLSNYQCVLGELQSFLDETSTNKLLMMGDLNADPIRKSRFWLSLKNFIDENELIMNDLSLPNSTFTYLNTAHNTTTWIDHVISSKSMIIPEITVRHDLALYDHFPMLINLKYQHEAYSCLLTPLTSNDNSYIDWEKLGKTECKVKYNQTIIDFMKNTEICLNESCTDDHRKSIESFYLKLINSMKNASTKVASQKDSRRRKTVPGWNKHCKDKYRIAREAFFIWMNSAKVRSGPIYERMKATRKAFQKSLKYCKFKEQQIRDENMYDDFTSNRTKGFWRKVKKRRGCNQSEINCVDGIADAKKIPEVFASKFSSVNGGEARVDADENVNTYENVNTSEDAYAFSTYDVQAAIRRLSTGTGFDGVHTNNLLYMNSLTIVYLKRFFNSCLIHSYLPQTVLDGVMLPQIKNKFGDSSDSSNFREVMISSNLFKLFEYLVMPKLQEKACLSPCHFGFREKTSTLDAITVMKEAAAKYVCEGSTVYSCFIDLSKAFERVNHRILLNKLQEMGVPLKVLRILTYILSNSFASVKVGSVRSRKWRIIRGVRQGGVLSAYFFNVYINSILEEISCNENGCRIGITKRNIQAYADDVVIFCPTPGGLQELINIFCAECYNHQLVINYEKTKILKFGRQDDYVFSANGVIIENVIQYKYLGVILSSDLCITGDVERVHASFNRNVGMLNRQFHSVDLDVKIKLFNTLCLPMYGLSLWSYRRKAKMCLKQLAVSYHLGLKRLLGYPKYFSNHFVCQELNVLTFEHFLNLQTVKAYFRLINSESYCMIGLRTYMAHFSSCKLELDKVFHDVYEVDDFHNNDYDALLSRAYYVQAREEASWFTGLPL